MTQDELMAEEIQRREEEEFRKLERERLELLQADEKLAQTHQELVNKEWEINSAKQTEADHELAMRAQKTVGKKHKK